MIRIREFLLKLLFPDVHTRVLNVVSKIKVLDNIYFQYDVPLDEWKKIRDLSDAIYYLESAIKRGFKNMNKQEILKEINKTEEHLANMKKMLAECEYERWKPEKGKMFYYLNSYNVAIPETWSSDYADAVHYNIYNCFKTREQAEAEAEKILVRRMLEDIARRLNKGKKFDWDDEYQYKWHISYNNFSGITTHSVSKYKTQGTIYCLDSDFYDVAIQEIGEERLKKYLRGE